MKQIQTLITAAVVAAGLISGAQAQSSKSTVNVDNAVQVGGAANNSTNKQTYELGNAAGGGQSSVKANNVVQVGGAANNSKNEQSHQDPTIGEALLGEMSDTARVLFPVDANSAIAAPDRSIITRADGIPMGPNVTDAHERSAKAADAFMRG